MSFWILGHFSLLCLCCWSPHCFHRGKILGDHSSDHTWRMWGFERVNDSLDHKVTQWHHWDLSPSIPTLGPLLCAVLNANIPSSIFLLFCSHNFFFYRFSQFGILFYASSEKSNLRFFSYVCCLKRALISGLILDLSPCLESWFLELLLWKAHSDLFHPGCPFSWEQFCLLEIPKRERTMQLDSSLIFV